MTLALLLGIAALLCAAFSFVKPQLLNVAVIMISIAVVLMGAGANTRIF